MGIKAKQRSKDEPDQVPPNMNNRHLGLGWYEGMYYRMHLGSGGAGFRRYKQLHAALRDSAVWLRKQGQHEDAKWIALLRRTSGMKCDRSPFVLDVPSDDYALMMHALRYAGNANGHGDRWYEIARRGGKNSIDRMDAGWWRPGP